MIEAFLPIAIQSQEYQDAKFIMRYDPKILAETSKIANYISEKSYKKFNSQEFFFAEISDDREPETHTARQANKTIDENALRPNTQISTKRSRKDRIKNALVLLSKKKHR